MKIVKAPLQKKLDSFFVSPYKCWPEYKFLGFALSSNPFHGYSSNFTLIHTHTYHKSWGTDKIIYHPYMRIKNINGTNMLPPLSYEYTFILKTYKYILKNILQSSSWTDKSKNALHWHTRKQSTDESTMHLLEFSMYR